MGLRLRERRRAIFIFIAICIPLILLNCRAVRASPDSGPDIEVPGGRKISDQGGMDVDAKQSSIALPEGSLHIDEALSLAGMATGAGLAAARRMMMQRQRDEGEKRKKGTKESGSSAQGSSSTKGSGSSAMGFVGGRPFAQGEPPRAMPMSFNAQPIDRGASDDEAFPWHEVPGAYLSSMASIPSGILEGLKEDYGAWRAYFEDPTSAAPSNIAPYLMQYGSESLGFPVKGINPDAGAAVMTAVDFLGLGKIPFTGNLPRGLILEQLKHGGGWEGLQEGFKYTSVGQVGTLASMALDPSMDEHLRAQCAGQLMAQGSVMALIMFGPKLAPKVKSGLAKILDEVKTRTFSETAETLGYIDVEDAIWRQAVNQAVQDGNLEVLAQNAGDLGELKSYYESGELSLILKGKTLKATEGHNVRIDLPPSLTEAFMAEEGPVQIELIDPVAGKTYGFYKDFHKVNNLDLDVPLGLASGLQADQEVILKMRKLPIWEFLNSGEGDGAVTIGFNSDGILIANLQGKQIPIQSLDYDYLSGRAIGGVAYLEFKVEDVYDEARRFRLYDNGFDERRFTIEMGRCFDRIEGLEYNIDRDLLVVEYSGHGDTSKTTFFFKKLPDEIDLDSGTVSMDMLNRARSGGRIERGKVGEEIAERFVMEKFKAEILSKGKYGPDREILIDDKLGIVEAKFVSSKSYLESSFVDAISDVCRRIKQNSENKQGVAFAVNVDLDTGQFEYVYRIVTPESLDTAFDGLHLTDAQIGKNKQLGINVGLLDRLPAIQSFAGYPINQGMNSNAQYCRQQMMFGLGQKGSEANSIVRQEESKIIGSSTSVQDTRNSRNSMNSPDTVGVGSEQLSMVHSQSQQQGPSNRHTEPPKQREQEQKVDDGSKATSGNKTLNSQYEDRGPSRPSNQYVDRQQTTFEGREGSGKSMAQQGQQRQQQGNKTINANSEAASVDNNSRVPGTRNDEPQTKFEDKKGVREDLGSGRKQQGQQSKQKGDNTTKNEATPPSSDKNSKSGSQQGQQTLNRGSETAKDNNRQAPSNSDSGSKGTKDPDTKNCAPSRGGGPIPI